MSSAPVMSTIPFLYWSVSLMARSRFRLSETRQLIVPSETPRTAPTSATENVETQSVCVAQITARLAHRSVEPAMPRAVFGHRGLPFDFPIVSIALIIDPELPLIEILYAVLINSRYRQVVVCYRQAHQEAGTRLEHRPLGPGPVRSEFCPCPPRKSPIPRGAAWRPGRGERAGRPVLRSVTCETGRPFPGGGDGCTVIPERCHSRVRA